MSFELPKTWKDLERIVTSHQLEELSVEFKRSLELTQTYELDRKRISKEQALQNIHAEIAATRTVLSTGVEVALTGNKYPYDRLLMHLPGVTHALLWFKGSLSADQAQAYLESLGKTCCLYANPVALKSIPEINHYQVFMIDNVHSLPMPKVA